MIIKLLNDGSYYGLEEVDFPVVVEDAKIEGCSVAVTGAALKAIGAADDLFDDYRDYIFDIGPECQVVGQKYTQSQAKRMHELLEFVVEKLEGVEETIAWLEFRELLAELEKGE